MDNPDETRTPEKTTVDVVHLGDSTVARLTAQPGWRWSDCIKPVAGTDTCQATHLGYVVSGRIHVAATDGTEADLSTGDTYLIAPGHDAWVVGEEPCVALEFESKTAATFAKGLTSPATGARRCPGRPASGRPGHRGGKRGRTGRGS